MPPPLENRRHFELWIDTCRWLAALAVLFTHVNNRFLIKILSLPHEQRTLPHYAYALLSGFGHQAVVVFFVISGLLVGGSFLEESKQADKPLNVLLTSYMLKRLVRLWTVLIPALALIALLDNAGIRFFNGVENGIYAGEDFTATAFFCNAAFLQTAACSQFGTDGALWSLYNEFWYYVLWPLVLFACMPLLASWKRGLCAVFAVALLAGLTWFQFVGSSFAPYFAIWLLGVWATTRARPFLPGSIRSALLVFLAYLLTFRALVPTAWMERTDGAWLARIEVRGGDNVGWSGERAEVSDMLRKTPTTGKTEHYGVHESDGHEFYGISVKVPADWQSPSKDHGKGPLWGLFLQLHSPDDFKGPPPFRARGRR